MRSPGLSAGHLALLPCLLTLGLARGVAAEEFWVAPDGVACNSSRCICEATAPCLASPALFGRLEPGDRLKLLPGEYPGFLIEDVHGLPEQKIVLQGVGKMVDGSPAARLRGDMSSARDAVELARSSHIALENLHVSRAARAGIRVNNSHHIDVRHSYLEANGVWGIFTNHANHFTAEGNTIIGPAEQHGIYQSNSGDHVRIVGNYVVDFDGCGLHFNGDLSMGGASGVKGDGIISDVEIRDNFLAGNGRVGGSAINLDGVERAIVENNILVGNQASGVAVFRHDGAIGSRGVMVARNLIVMPPGSRWALNFNRSEGNNQVEGNVIVAQDGYRGIHEVISTDAETSPSAGMATFPFRADNNAYYYRRNFAVFNGSTHFSLRQWQQEGQDTQSTFVPVNGVIGVGDGYRVELPAVVVDAMTTRDVAPGNPYLFLVSNADE